jgi:hypothetical protein
VTGLREVELDELDGAEARHWERWLEVARRAVSGGVPTGGNPMLESKVGQLRELDLDRLWAGRCEPGSPPSLRGVRLPAGRRAVAAIAIHSAQAEPGAALRVLQRRETGVAGGSTILFRPSAREGLEDGVRARGI